MSGNLVLVNGRILTMDPDRPEVAAVAMLGGRIAAVGSDDEVREAVGPRVETIDLRGRTATPGLNDAHAHPMGVGHALSDLNVATPPNASIRDIIERVVAETRRRVPGTWIVGRGYDQARLAEQRHPTRHDLDPVSPSHPVLLIRACHHIGVANSRALELAGISAEQLTAMSTASRPVSCARRHCRLSVQLSASRPRSRSLRRSCARAGST